MLLIKELRLSPIAIYQHENYERKNVYIMLFCPSHDLNEYFLDYYVGENIEMSNSGRI